MLLNSLLQRFLMMLFFGSFCIYMGFEKCILQQCLQVVCDLAILVQATVQDINFLKRFFLFLFLLFPFFRHPVAITRFSSFSVFDAR